MKGLEQILQKIEDDAVAEAEKIKAEAMKTAEKIISDATERANADARELIDNGQKKASVMLENAKSGCASLIKRTEASAKAEVVDDCIRLAVSDITSMPDEEYFEIMRKLILKYYHPNEQGELLMNKADISKMPKSFLKEIKKSGADIELCDKPADIDCGFIIRYGGVEENCTLASLIEENTDKIKDRLYKMLWEV